MKNFPSLRGLRAASRLIRSLGDNRTGSIGTIFALSVVPLMLFVSAAIDFSSGAAAKASLRAALDAAVLGGVQAPVADRVSQASAIFQAALGKSSITGVSATFSNNGDGSLSGTVTGTIPTSLASIANIIDIPVSASAKASPGGASQAPSTIVFSLTGGYGWYWKEVGLYVHESGAANDTLLANYIYQPTNLSGQNGRGTGAVTAQFLSAGNMVDGFVNTSVSLGSTYDNAYLAITVYSDGCGPGMAPQTPQSSSTTNFTCIASGTKVQTGTSRGKPVYTTYTKTTSPVVYSTKDATTANHLFVDGVALPIGQVPSVFSLLSCDETLQHAWEDTPWTGSYAGSWSQQDVFFSVQTTACTPNGNYPTSAYLDN